MTTATLRLDLAAPQDLVTLLEARAAEHGERGYAFFTDGEAEPAQLSYRALARRARALGQRLVADGATGEAVLILCPPGLDYIVAFFGCLYAGAIATPAYPPDPMRLRRTLPRLRAIVADTGARLVLTTSPFLGVAPLVACEAPELASLTWLAADGDEASTAAEVGLPAPSSAQLAFLQYTSGSTSQPKGVMVSHRNLIHNLERIRQAFEFTPTSRLAFWLPPYHDMGLIGGILAPLYAGCDVALMSPLDFLKRPMAWLEMVARTRADTTGAPNFAYDLVVRRSRSEERAALDLSCLTLAFNAAEPVRSATLDGFAEAFAVSGLRRSSLFSCYGLAETTLLATATKRGTAPAVLEVSAAALERLAVEPATPAGAGTRALVSIGRSADVDALRVVADGRALPDGEVGEIWLRSASVAEGYWRREAETRETFGAFTAAGEGPFLRTGDLGFIANGELFFVSRKKDLVIVRGKNHYPQDLELAAEGAHPALRRGCGVAFGVSADEGERLVIVWEVDPARAPEPGQVISRLRAAVAEREGVFVDEVVLIEPHTLPKTSSGKLQRQKAKSEHAEGTLAIVAEWRAPRADAMAASARATESLKDFLIERVASCLGVSEDTIDPDLPLHHHGFDSKMVVELAADLSSRVGRDLPTTLVFNYPTINKLTDHLAA